MDILIDLMSPEDLPRVMEIERSSFTDPWSEESFLRDLEDNPYSLYLIAVMGRTLLGYLGGWTMKKRLHITNLAIDDKYRRRGIATSLIKELIQISYLQGIERVTLEVRVSNNTAICLYKKLGFKKVGYKTGYYKNDEDAMIMWREFENAR
jgi:ribosomal-protein-alanine N-acetyltransferase